MTQRVRRPSPVSRLAELFDASALGLLTLLLVSLSFFATWRGMRDFVIGNDLAAGLASQGLVIAIVLTLTLAMYVALREVISPSYVPNWWASVWKRLVALPLYLLLAVWSVGFGYGFWWSVIAGQGVTDSELTQSVVALREETSDVRSRILAAGSVMASAEVLSNQKAQNEAERGGTCGVSSPPGDGPLARARSETQSQIAALSATVQGDWLGSISTRLDTLDATLVSAREIGGADTLARKAAFENVYTTARLAAREISTDAAARGRSLSAQLRSKADQLSVAPVDGRVIYCFDPDLAASLLAAANELEQPFEIAVPDFRFSEGAEGVARAVEDLWGGLLSRTGLLPPRSQQGPPTGRSLIALIATIGVDLALLVFALLQGRGHRLRMRTDRQAAGDVIEAADTQQDPAAPIQAATPAKTLPAPAKTERVDSDDSDQIIDAEFSPSDDRPPIAQTFEPESQLSDEEQLAELLRNAQVHLQEITAAGTKLSETQARNRLNDVLRQLRRIGYEDAGMDDVQYQSELHQVVGHEVSDVPKGQIVRVVRPRFMSAGGKQVLIPALVIISKGR
ncbi:MAG: hypothetical protein AAGK23_05705 [Pseudomonadota bacterium]